MEGGNIRLNEFVRIKVSESRNKYNPNSPFGLESYGKIINNWHMVFNRIEFFVSNRGISDFNNGSIVHIYVPGTETGVEPLAEELRSFGWDGKINEFAAELAVWCAFELLTEKEAENFLMNHRPNVIFQFFEDNACRELNVKFNGENWIIV